MNGIALIVVLVSAATALPSPFSIFDDSPLIAANKSILTPEDITTFLRIIEQEESLYSKLMTESLADYGLLVESKVIGAYNVSQETGQCATIIERVTINGWYGQIETSRHTITNNTETAKEALYTAENPEEILAAAKLFIENKKLNFECFMQFIIKINDSFINVIEEVAKCNN